MNELLPLIKLIAKRKISDKYILKSLGKQNKQDELYSALKNGKVKTDIEAILYLYGSDAHRYSYMRMKRRLKEKLFNSLVTIDQQKQKYSTRKKAYYKVMKMYVVSSLLSYEGETYLMASLLEDTLKHAIKYEIVEYIKLMAKQLVSHYSIRSKDDKKLIKFNKIYRDYSKIEDFEFRANIYYYELSKMYQDKTPKKGAFLNKLRDYGDELKKYQKEIFTYDFNLRAFTINSTRYIFEGDYQKAIQNAETAIEYVSRKPFDSVRDKFSFNSDKIISYILLGEHDKAESLIKSTEKILSLIGINLFRLQGYAFQNYVISKNYDPLPSIVAYVQSFTELKKYNMQFEIWKIREAYVRFMIEANLLNNPILEQNRQFRIARFINEVPIFSKEKRGMNVSILVIQILFSLVRKKYNDVIDRIDALKQYSFRYLRRDDTFRSNCFIKMILKIPLADFHPLRSELHANDLYKRLIAYPFDVQELTNEREVIPYNDLWLMIIQVLKNNNKKGKELKK